MDSPILFETARSYNRLAEVYETRWADYLRHTHERFLAQITIHKSNVLLDLSCGTGLLEKYLFEGDENFKQLILNDIAGELQAVAKNRFARRNDVRFTCFSAQNLKLPPQSVDKIFCLNAFHNYQYQSHVLGECRRVLKPSGKLYILDWNRSGWFRIKNWLIKKSGKERIDTKSAPEITAMLREQHFELSSIREWYHRSWKFYYVISEKK